MFRFVCLLAFVAACNAGVATYNGAAVIAPTYTSEQQNVYRSHGNLQQISYNSKTIDTPYSSVSKSDVRVSNPGVAVTNYAAVPAVHTAYHAAPAVHTSYHAQPAVHTSYHAQPAIHTAYHAQPAIQTAYHAQPAVYAQPATKTIISSPAQTVYSAPAYHHAPATHQVVAAAPATKLLGVAYSPATAVSHMSYQAPLISYGW